MRCSSGTGSGPTASQRGRSWLPGKAGAGDRSGRAPLWPNRSSWAPLRTWTTAGSCSRRVADQGPVTWT
jgi:hypothetical protein